MTPLCACLFRQCCHQCKYIVARVHSCTPHRHIVENEEPCRMKSKVSSSMQGSNEASVHPVVDSK